MSDGVQDHEPRPMRWDAEARKWVGATKEAAASIDTSVEAQQLALLKRVRDAERAHCAEVADLVAAEWEADIARGSLSAALLQGMADGARIVARRIREGGVR